MPGVGLLVGLEVVSEGEGEAARLAPEGLLPGVDQLVPLELGVLPEHARASGPVAPDKCSLDVYKLQVTSYKLPVTGNNSLLSYSANIFQ